MTTLRTRLAAALLALPLVLIAPAQADASPQTLRRSVGNIVQFPLDLVLSPVVAAKSIYTNLRTVDDSLAVKIVYPVPGFFWVTSVQAGAAVLRGVAGLVEFIPGLILVPFETDLDPLFDPVHRNAALVDVDTPPLYIKFGVDYTSTAY